MKNCFTLFFATPIIIGVLACNKINPCVTNLSVESSQGNRITQSDIVVDIYARLGFRDTKASLEFSIEPVVEKGDTLAYLVNYCDGWELLSADRRTDPVLMMCKSGKMTKDDLVSNPAQKSVIDGLYGYLHTLCETPDTKSGTAYANNSNPTPPMSYIDENGTFWAYSGRYLSGSSEQKQNPLTGLKWGQGTKSATSNKIWNICCPFDSPALTTRCYTGCVPVAIAQTLCYLHSQYSKPSNIYNTSSTNAYLQDTTSTVTITNSNTVFSQYGNYWSNLPVDKVTASSAQLVTASTMMIDIGKRLKSSYGYNGTTSSMSNVQSVFSSYGYNSTCRNGYTDNFRSQIYVNKVPIIVSIHGNRVLSGQTSTLDHTVVIEGYNKRTEHYTYVYKNGDSGTFIYQYKPYTFTYEYIAVNWGYDGRGEYNESNDIIWNNLGNVLTRNFSNGYDQGTIDYMVYGFSVNQ